MSSTTAGRPVRRHADDYFFITMALLLLGMVFVGFARITNFALALVTLTWVKWPNTWGMTRETFVADLF
ncbi:MAG: hypothetical protein WBD73_07700, partial [Candidatus Acidiferrales bacterium]